MSLDRTMCRDFLGNTDVIDVGWATTAHHFLGNLIHEKLIIIRITQQFEGNPDLTASDTATYRGRVSLARGLSKALSKVQPRIFLDQAAMTSRAPLTGSAELAFAAAKVSPRIVLENAASTARLNFAGSQELASASGKVAPRIVVEGAAISAFYRGLQSSDALSASASKVGPRIRVEGAPISALQTLGPPLPLPAE